MKERLHARGHRMNDAKKGFIIGFVDATRNSDTPMSLAANGRMQAVGILCGGKVGWEARMPRATARKTLEKTKNFSVPF